MQIDSNASAAHARPAGIRHEEQVGSSQRFLTGKSSYSLILLLVLVVMHSDGDE
jgi:hypothetical protein